MTGSAQPPPFELAGPPAFLSTVPPEHGERRIGCDLSDRGAIRESAARADLGLHPDL